MFVLLMLGAASAVYADTPAGPSLTLQISNETAPAGGWVQLKISLGAPGLVGSGRIVMDLDPSVFGNIGTVSVFSASGDVYGIATVQGQHLDASFTSPSGGIGQLRNLPVLVATVPILQTATPGAVAKITADPSQSTWQDPQGNAYSVSVAAGSVTVGGSVSVKSVAPGGGLISAGAKLQVQGAGFTPQSTVSIDGVSIASTAYLSSSEIDVTLAGPTEMTGKRVVVSNGSASGVISFSSLGGVAPETSGVPGQTGSAFPNTQPIFPLETQSTGEIANSSERATNALCLQNPTSAPISATLAFYIVNSFSSSSSVTVPPYSSELFDVRSFGTVVVSAKEPLRMVGIIGPPLPLGPTPIGIPVPSAVGLAP